MSNEQRRHDGATGSSFGWSTRWSSEWSSVWAAPVVRAVVSASMVAGLVASAVVPMIAVTGCEEKKPPPPPPPPPPPAPPPPPPPVEVEPVLKSMAPDARVQFPQGESVPDETLVRAVISFADALAKGDDKKLRTMMTPDAQSMLSGLVDTGDFADAVSKIEGVRIVNLTQVPSDQVAGTAGVVYFAIQESSGAYVLGFAGNKAGEWKFSGAPGTNGKRRRASDWDSASVVELSTDSGPAKRERQKLPDAPATPPPPPADGGAPAAPAGPNSVPPPSTVPPNVPVPTSPSSPSSPGSG